MICIITMYIRDTNMAYIHTLKYFLNMLFLVAALTERLFKCIILDVSPQFSNFIFFIHSIFKKYIVLVTYYLTNNLIFDIVIFRVSIKFCQKIKSFTDL